jgi:hypothetical protein
VITHFVFFLNTTELSFWIFKCHSIDIDANGNLFSLILMVEFHLMSLLGNSLLLISLKVYILTSFNILQTLKEGLTSHADTKNRCNMSTKIIEL